MPSSPQGTHPDLQVARAPRSGSYSSFASPLKFLGLGVTTFPTAPSLAGHTPLRFRSATEAPRLSGIVSPVSTLHRWTLPPLPSACEPRARRRTAGSVARPPARPPRFTTGAGDERRSGRGATGADTGGVTAPVPGTVAGGAAASEGARGEATDAGANGEAAIEVAAAAAAAAAVGVAAVAGATTETNGGATATGGARAAAPGATRHIGGDNRRAVRAEAAAAAEEAVVVGGGGGSGRGRGLARRTPPVGGGAARGLSPRLLCTGQRGAPSRGKQQRCRGCKAGWG